MKQTLPAAILILAIVGAFYLFYDRGAYVQSLKDQYKIGEMERNDHKTIVNLEYLNNIYIQNVGNSWTVAHNLSVIIAGEINRLKLLSKKLPEKYSKLVDQEILYLEKMQQINKIRSK